MPARFWSSAPQKMKIDAQVKCSRTLRGIGGVGRSLCSPRSQKSLPKRSRYQAFVRGFSAGSTNPQPTLSDPEFSKVYIDLQAFGKRVLGHPSLDEISSQSPAKAAYRERST